MKKLLLIFNILYTLPLCAQNDTIINGLFTLPNLDLKKYQMENKLREERNSPIMPTMGKWMKLKLDVDNFKKSTSRGKTIYELTIKNCSKHCRYYFSFSYYNNVSPYDSIYVIDDGDSAVGSTVSKTMHEKKGFRTQSSARNSNTLKVRLVLNNEPDTNLYLNKINIMFPNTSLNPETGKLNKSSPNLPQHNSRNCSALVGVLHHKRQLKYV